MATILKNETDDHILAVVTWTLGQIGKHTPEHAKSVADENVLSKLLEVCKFLKRIIFIITMVYLFHFFIFFFLFLFI